MFFDYKDTKKIRDFQILTVNFARFSAIVKEKIDLGAMLGLCYLFVTSYVRSFSTLFASKLLITRQLTIFNVRSFENRENSTNCLALEKVDS